jgi:hypothetical protein
MIQQAPPASSRWQIASTSGWMAARAIQAFFVIAFLKFGYLAAKSGEVLDLVSNLLMICLVFAYGHRFATGEISQDGVRFRRYFRERQLAWQDVREIRWRGSSLVLILKKGNFLSRRLDFILNPLTAIVPYWRHRQDLDTPLLPILERIHALAGETLEIVSAPAQPRWMVRGFIGLVLLMLAVMLMRLLMQF